MSELIYARHAAIKSRRETPTPDTSENILKA